MSDNPRWKLTVIVQGGAVTSFIAYEDKKSVEKRLRRTHWTGGLVVLEAEFRVCLWGRKIIGWHWQPDIPSPKPTPSAIEEKRLKLEERLIVAIEKAAREGDEWKEI